MDSRDNLPAALQPQYSADAIAEQVARIGTEISAWAKEVWQHSHTDILAIPVLRGGIFFFADLVRNIEHSVEIAPARTWAYEKIATQRTEVEVNIQHVPAKGRAVLLVDDICDSGRTLQVLRQSLLDAGARVVRSTVLIKRILAEKTFEPDWVGFSYQGPEWMVGYGMDNDDRWRNLPSIYVIRQV
jgi:hypoxanthine phosphoribosyltransferase